MKLNQIVQHIPPYVDGIKPQKVQYKTEEELFAIPWVKNWADLPKFQEFYVAKSDLCARIDGRHFLVGYLS